MRYMRRKATGASGQTTVEFAIILPLLLVLLMGIIEFGRIWSTQNSLTNAAREGSRLGVLSSTAPSDVEATVLTYLENTGQNPDRATITVTNAGSSGITGSDVSVTVEYDFQVIVGNILGMDSTMELTSTSVMRHE